MTDILVIGLSLGCVYGFVAVGFTLVYRTTNIMNFSQGAFVMLGGMGAGYAAEEWGASTALSALVGVGLAAFAGLILVVLLVLPLWRRGASDFLIILATLLFLLAAQNVVLNVMGSESRRVDPLPFASGFDLGPLDISGQVLWIIGATVVVTAGLTAFLNRTTLGIAMRAVATDRNVSRMAGISPERIAVVAFVGGAVLGGVGGVLIAPIQVAIWSSATAYNVNGFIAAIIGGLHDIRLAVLGGLVVGVGQVLVAFYISTTYLEPILLASFVLILLLKPTGLFNRQVAIKY